MSTTIASRLQGLGIADMDKEIKQGTASIGDVMLVIRGRIEKRIRLGEKLIPKVCQYHDELAAAFEKSTGQAPLRRQGTQVRTEHRVYPQ